MSVPANPSVGGPSEEGPAKKGSTKKSHVELWLSITLILILLLMAAPFIMSFAGAFVADVSNCQGGMQIRSPCLLQGNDVSQTLTTMIYMGYLGFITVPFGEFLLAIWAVVAFVVGLSRWRRRRQAV
ncbi:MAG TPA: hypothetical protein VK825_11000 [Xanthobacteraceae bacterium]|nr:hypothetical protein [Xanthobacteraceae bacterium]